MDGYNGYSPTPNFGGLNIDTYLDSSVYRPVPQHSPLTKVVCIA